MVDYPLPGDYEGLYAPAKDLILLDVRLSPVQRRCVLAHEISHAKHRDLGCRCDRWTERRADMEASALLIDPLEYAFAESVYGQNVHGIAVELGVMPWVVGAYREWLHDHGTLVIQ
ncbi:ImmA/IrrE family metallo-endopeptidase [Bifidobacterium pseudolongum]|uniref:IrrE N-terminal-like domain-containing protein n=1 Tax=Bifidobacterium pseudolongum subsp. globosum TaxID=1690 RepID=A0A4Q5AQH6_9BIFI|nr:ImmA/IrrE family metallo-endopeptidase [Bifidobacterium pseudolongum]RYQ36071.1 hypothetical protein PG2003B_1163 [Bifidobacterium pseudolongum subsp. globosum]